MKQPKIQESSIIYIVFIAFTDKDLRKCSLRFLRIILLYFFVAQFKSKLFKDPPVVNVNHPLDREIPFRAEKVKVYLRFIQHYVSALSYIRKMYGERVNGEIISFINGLAAAYKDSGYIYSKRVSTTWRPKNYLNPKFLTIHIFDPHLYCIPSLHVIIACYTYLRIRKVCKEYGWNKDVEKQVELLYVEAVKILESILYIRQHSINCISAGLFVGTKMFPDFTQEESLRFIRSLFKEDEKAIKKRREILKYIEDLYLKFLDQAEDVSDYRDLLVNFLLFYEKCQRKEEACVEFSMAHS